MLAERSFVRKAAFLHHMGRYKVQLIALPVHPVQGELFKTKGKERPEDLGGISLVPVLRQQDIPDLCGTLQFGIDLNECKARKRPCPRYPDRKQVIPPVAFPL